MWGKHDALGQERRWEYTGTKWPITSRMTAEQRSLYFVRFLGSGYWSITFGDDQVLHVEHFS